MILKGGTSLGASKYLTPNIRPNGEPVGAPRRAPPRHPKRPLARPRCPLRPPNATLRTQQGGASRVRNRRARYHRAARPTARPPASQPPPRSRAPLRHPCASHPLRDELHAERGGPAGSLPVHDVAQASFQGTCAGGGLVGDQGSADRRSCTNRRTVWRRWRREHGRAAMGLGSHSGRIREISAYGRVWGETNLRIAREITVVRPTDRENGTCDGRKQRA